MAVARSSGLLWQCMRCRTAVPVDAVIRYEPHEPEYTITAPSRQVYTARLSAPARVYFWQVYGRVVAPETERERVACMDAFEVNELPLDRVSAEARYHEFLRAPALSAGLYRVPAGGTDPQQPHTEDEVYYVVSGRGTIRVGAEDRPVQAGSIIYVAANVEHRFHDVGEDLIILVFFAPAEYSQRP